MGRCAGKSGCRDSTPKRYGCGCNANKGHCDGNGNCLNGPPRRRRIGRFRFPRGAKKLTVKKLLKKRNLNIRKKFKNFNLAQLNKKLKNDLERNQEIFEEEENENENEENDFEEQDDDGQEETEVEKGLALFDEDN